MHTCANTVLVWNAYLPQCAAKCITELWRFLHELSVSVRLHVGWRARSLLHKPQNEKPQADKSGDNAGQETPPFLDKMWFLPGRLTAMIEFVAVCEVAPSCWNHEFSLISGNRVNSRVRKVSIPRTLRTPYIIVAIQLWSSKKYGPQSPDDIAQRSLRSHFPMCPSILLNVQRYSPHDTASHSGRHIYCNTAVWVPRISQRLETYMSYLKILWKYIPKHFQYCRHCLEKKEWIYIMQQGVQIRNTEAKYKYIHRLRLKHVCSNSPTNGRISIKFVLY